MSAASTMLQTSTIQQSCKQLRLPGVGSQFAPLAEQAERDGPGHMTGNILGKQIVPDLRQRNG